MKTSRKSASAILLALCCSFQIAYGDDTQFNYMPTDYSILPPPPEVASLIEHNEIAVSYNSGRPDISFTLFSIKSGALELPVVLSYQSGGIKAGQKPGNAGLGWSLLANAAIGRNVVGLPDELETSMDNESVIGLLVQQKQLSDAAQKDYNFRDYLIKRAEENIDPTSPRDILQSYGTENTQCLRYDWGYTDLANDICTLSGLGLSATFAYTDNSSIVQTSEHPVKIHTQATPYCDGFEVDDASGTHYIFNEKEESWSLHRHGNPIMKQQEDTIRHISAWYLTSMRNISGDSITLTYEKEAVRWWGSSSSSRHHSLNPDFQVYVPELTSGGGMSYSRPSLLSVIKGDGVEARFFYRKKEYADRYTNFMIDSIAYVYQGTERASIGFKFNYDAEARYLTSIKRNGEVVYRFEYEHDANLSKEGTDFGGYRNGRGITYGIPPCRFVVGDDGDDRSVNSTYAAEGSLKSINYPTGGKDILEWESHSVCTVNGENITTNPNTTSEQLTINTDTLCGLNIDGMKKTLIENYRVSQPGAYYIKISEYFQFDPTIFHNSDYNAKHETGADLPQIKYPCVVFRNKNKNNEVAKRIYIDSLAMAQPVDESGYMQLPLAAGLYDIELLYPYEVSLMSGSLEEMFKNTQNGGNIYIQERVKTAPVSDLSNVRWPGLRIRSITSEFGDTPPVCKVFYYSNDKESGTTSGDVRSMPEFTHFYYLVMQGKATNSDMTYWNFDTYSQIYVTGTHGMASDYGSGPSVEYSDVGVVLSQQNSVNSQLAGSDIDHYHYSTALDDGNKDPLNRTLYLQSQPASQRVNTSRAFRRGLLVRHDMARQGKTRPTVYYDYNIYEADSPAVLTTDAFVVTNFTNWANETVGPSVKHLYSIGKFSLIPYFKTTKSEVFTDGGFRTSVNYKYFVDGYTDRLDRELVKARVDSLADGRVKTTYYTYVSDDNMHLPLKETEITVEDGVIISGEYRTYDKAFRLTAIHPLKKKGASFAESLISGKSATTQLINYFGNTGYRYSYDDGRLVEIRYNNQVLVSYLWDYEDLYPAVEATGVSYSQLRGACQGSPRDAAESLRENFPGASIKVLKWSPLVGPAEINEGDHMVSRYGYDRQGRLTTVRDVNNSLIEQYYYVY